MANALDDDISSLLTGGLITLHVGPKRKRYKIHRKLLRKYNWFKQRPLYKSHPNAYLHLYSDEPAHVELLTNWLYRGTWKAIFNTDNDLAKKHAKLYVSLYLRAETCELGYLPQSLIKKIYNGTNDGAPLRCFMVDTFLHKSLGWDEAAQIEDPTDPDCILDRETAIYNQMEYGNLEFASECYEALFQLCAKSKIRDPSRVVSITSMRVRRNAKLEETDEKGSSIVGTCNREEFRTQPTNQIHPF